MNKHERMTHWENVFQRHKESGLNIVEFCKNETISLSSFHLWRKRSKEQSNASQKVIPLIFQETQIQQATIIKLTTPKGYQLEFDSTLSPETLSNLMSMM